MVFTQNNPYWNTLPTSWGFTLGPFSLIGAFLMLVIGWMIRTRIKQGLWSAQITPIRRVDLSGGIVAMDNIQTIPRFSWRRFLHRFLNAI